jgi:hypothetical protein
MAFAVYPTPTTAPVVRKKRAVKPEVTHIRRLVMKYATSQCPRGLSKAQRLECLRAKLREAWQLAKQGLLR